MRRHAAATVLILLSAACIRRDGRNSDCRWPGSDPGAPLAAEAEFAEDLAIRYADVHHGLRSRGFASTDVYRAERSRCMVQLFGRIAEDRHITVDDVRHALKHGRPWVETALVLPAAIAYMAACLVLFRMLWLRYPPASFGWTAGILAAAALALLLAVTFTLVGEFYYTVAETFRTGNDHMSYRTERYVWVRHRAAIFALSLAVASIFAARNAHRARNGAGT